MSTDYFPSYTSLSAHTLGRAEALDAIFDAIVAGFALLPSQNELKQDRVTFCTDAGVGGNYVLTPPYALGAYTAGASFRFVAGTVNTASSTVNISSLGVKSIVRQDGTALVASDIPAGSVPQIAYDGTQFRLVSMHMAMAAANSTAQAAVAIHAALTSTHGVSGNIVGTSDAQALTNKTISGASNTLSNIGNGSLSNSSITIAGHAVALGGSQTLAAADLTNGTSGSGAVVLVTGATLVTPTLGVATATSINFGGAALSSYVEGAFTPTLSFGGGSTGMTGTFVGQYRKFGKSVWFTLKIILTAKGSSTGTASIGGLPFTSSATANISSAITVTADTMAAGVTHPLAIVANNGTTITPNNFSAGSQSGLADTSFNNTSSLIITGTYSTDS